MGRRGHITYGSRDLEVVVIYYDLSICISTDCAQSSYGGGNREPGWGFLRDRILWPERGFREGSFWPFLDPLFWALNFGHLANL